MMEYTIRTERVRAHRPARVRTTGTDSGTDSDIDSGADEFDATDGASALYRAGVGAVAVLAAALLLLLVVTGCGETEGPGAGGVEGASGAGQSKADQAFGPLPEDGLPTLVFDADYSVSQTGPLVSGEKVRIRYALSRLPDC